MNNSINKTEESLQLMIRHENNSHTFLGLPKHSFVHDNSSNNNNDINLIQLHQCPSPSSSKTSLSRLKTTSYHNNSNNHSNANTLSIINNNDYNVNANVSLFELKKTITKAFQEDNVMNNIHNTYISQLELASHKSNHTNIKSNISRDIVMNNINNAIDSDKDSQSSGYEAYKQKQPIEEDPHERVNRRLIKKDKICDTDTEDSASDDSTPKKWIILPDSPFKKTWNFLIALIILYSAIVTPYSIAFQESSNSIEQYIEYSFDSILGIDIVLNFFSAYNDKDENLIKNHKKIIHAYLKSWFVLDVISVFPFTAFTNQLKYNLGKISRISRLPKLYKLFKLAKLIRITKMTQTGNVSSLTKVFLERLKMNSNVEKLLYFFLTFLLLSHLSTCIWYFVAKMQDLSPDSWVVRLGYIDSTNFQIYVLAFYWTLTTVTTVGYGDISAGTTPERIYNIFIMSFGVLMYSFAIGSLSSIVAAMDRKTAEMNQKLNILTSIKKEYNLDKTLFDKVRKVIKFDLSRNQRDKMQFLQELPNKLRIELSQIMHDKVIQNLNFFRDQPNDFFAYVASLLKPVKFCQGDYLYKTDDLIEEMYFVSKGTIIFCLDRTYSEKEFKEIKKNNNFGEIEMCLLEKLRFNIKVKSRSCELFTLKKNDFLRLSVNFKEFIEKFLHKSLMVYLKYNENRQRLIDEYEALIEKVNQQNKTNSINDDNDNDNDNEDGNDNNNNGDNALLINNDKVNDRKGGDINYNYDADADYNQSDPREEDMANTYLNSKKNIKTEELKKKMNFALVESKLINSQFTSKNSIKYATEIGDQNGLHQNEMQLGAITANINFQKKIEAIIEYIESNGIEFPDSENNPKVLFEELIHETDIIKREVLVMKIEQSIKTIYS